MNLRKDHYHTEIQDLFLRDGGPYRLDPGSCAIDFSVTAVPRCSLLQVELMKIPKFLERVKCGRLELPLFVAVVEKRTTFSNGCLGSHIDEERSEMRYVVRIAIPRESSRF